VASVAPWREILWLRLMAAGRFIPSGGTTERQSLPKATIAAAYKYECSQACGTSFWGQ
jgi:hypothetical protein